MIKKQFKKTLLMSNGAKMKYSKIVATNYLKSIGYKLDADLSPKEREMGIKYIGFKKGEKPVYIAVKAGDTHMVKKGQRFYQNNTKPQYIKTKQFADDSSMRYEMYIVDTDSIISKVDIINNIAVEIQWDNASTLNDIYEAKVSLLLKNSLNKIGKDGYNLKDHYNYTKLVKRTKEENLWQR